MKRRWLLALILISLLGLGALLVNRVQQQSALYARADEVFQVAEQFFRAGQKSLLFGKGDQPKQDVTANARVLFPANWQPAPSQLTHAFGGSLQVWLEIKNGQRHFTLDLHGLAAEPCALLTQLFSQRWHRLVPPQQFAVNTMPVREYDLMRPAAQTLCKIENSLQLYIRY